MALKGNQGHLLDDVKEAFEQTREQDLQVHTTLETGHGRIEKRSCQVITDTAWVCKYRDWPGLRSLVKVTAERTNKLSGEKTVESRYYISSLDDTAENIFKATRQHWAIENKLHWMLDVHFSEDASTKRAGNAAQNFALIARIALNLLQNEKSRKISMKKKRLLAGWETDYLAKILFKEKKDAFAPTSISQTY